MFFMEARGKGTIKFAKCKRKLRKIKFVTDGADANGTNRNVRQRIRSDYILLAVTFFVPLMYIY